MIAIIRDSDGTAPAGGTRDHRQCGGSGADRLGWQGSDRRRAQLVAIRRAKAAPGEATIPLAALYGGVTGDQVGCLSGLAEPTDITIVAPKTTTKSHNQASPNCATAGHNDVACPSTHIDVGRRRRRRFIIEPARGDETNPCATRGAGVLVDSWYGQMSDRHRQVANTWASQTDAFAAAEGISGQDVVRSALRVRDSFDLEPVGAVKPYLCHELCELGSTEWLPR